MFLALISDLTRQPAVNAARYRHLGWFWFGCIMFGAAFWIGVGFGINALVGSS